MAGIGTKPSMIKSPIPGQAQSQQNFQVAQSSMQKSPAPVQEESQNIAAVEAPIDDMEADFAQFQASSMEDDFNQMQQGMRPLTELYTQQTETGEYQEKQPTTPEEVGDALRFKLSFAETDREKRAVLEKAFPGANVSQDGSDYVIQTADGKSFITDDSGKLNVGDIADFAAEAVGMGAAALATAGLLASAPLSGGATVPALAGVGAISGIADRGARDLVASQVLDIERDPERSTVGEYGINAAMGGLFGGVGGAIEKAAAKHFGDSEVAAQVTKMVNPKYSGDIKSQLSAVKGLIDDGLLVPDKVNPNVALPDELVTADETVGAAGRAKISKIYNEYLDSRDAGPLKGLWDNVVGKVANLADDVKDVGNRFANIIDDDTSTFGKQIGSFRDKVLKQGSKTKANLDNSIAAIDPNNADSVMNDLGFSFNFKDGTLELGQIRNAAGEKGIKATPQSIAKEIGVKVNSDRTALDMANELIKFNKMIISNGGQIPIAQAEKLRAEYGKRANTLFNSNDNFAGNFYAKLRKNLEEDIFNGIESKLAPDEIAKFQAAKARYAEISDAKTALKNVLKADNVMAEKFASDIFNSKNLSADMLKQFKIVAKEDPTLLKDAFGTYVNSLIKGSANPREMASKLTKIPDAVINIVTEGSGISPKQWKETIGLLDKMSKTARAGVHDRETAGLWLRGTLALSDKLGAWGMASLAENILRVVDVDGKAISYLRGAPIETLLKGIPANKKSFAEKVINNWIASTDPVKIGIRAAAKQAPIEGAESLVQPE